MMTKKQMRLTRSEVPVQQTWDLGDLFPSDASWNKALKTVQTDISKSTKYKGLLNTNSDTLLACLTTMGTFQQHVVKVANYAMLKANADGTDSSNQSDFTKVQAVLAGINADLAFVESELLTIPTETIEQFLQENKKLKTYEKMRSEEHTSELQSRGHLVCRLLL